MKKNINILSYNGNHGIVKNLRDNGILLKIISNHIKN